MRRIVDEGSVSCTTSAYLSITFFYCRLLPAVRNSTSQEIGLDSRAQKQKSSDDICNDSFRNRIDAVSSPFLKIGDDVSTSPKTEAVLWPGLHSSQMRQLLQQQTDTRVFIFEPAHAPSVYPRIVRQTPVLVPSQPPCQPLNHLAAQPPNLPEVVLQLFRQDL